MHSDHVAADEQLKVVVLDKDPRSSDIIGTVQLALYQLALPGQIQNTWFQLENGKRNTGEIKLNLSMLEVFLIHYSFRISS